MFWRYFWAGFLSVKIGEYVAAMEYEKMATKEYEKMAMKAKEKRDRRKRIEGLEDVLTEEEKQILMDMD